jgi:ribosomal protein S18 acetylase RimI-like enzyme
VIHAAQYRAAMRLRVGSEDFARPGPGFVDRGAELGVRLAAGTARRQWCFLADVGGAPVARLGFATNLDPEAPVESRHPDVQLLREALRRVPVEVGIFVLDHLPGHAEAAGQLLREALGRLALPSGAVVEARVNPETEPDVVGRGRILTAGGLSLFQEKQGYAWSAARSAVLPTPPDGLRLTPVSECGLAPFLAVMGEAGAGTLDRNDRYYQRLCGSQGWARVMAEFLAPGEEDTWCLAADGYGREIGFVAVSAFPEPSTATITHVGVLPGHRGQGHGRRLVAAGTALAAGAGYTAMINEVDVDNTPMTRAFLDAGHRDDARLWHVWHYRAVVS